MNAMTGEKLFQILCAKEYSRFYARNLIMRHLNLIADTIGDEPVESVCLGFEQTPRGSGHSLAMAVTDKNLYIAAEPQNSPNIVRVPLQRIRSVSWHDPCMVLSLGGGDVSIRTDEKFTEYLKKKTAS